LSHADETFSRGWRLKLCGKNNSDSYTSRRLGSRKKVISKVIWVGKQKNWAWMPAEATDIFFSKFSYCF
jgi:hypothetical protein